MSGLTHFIAGAQLGIAAIFLFIGLADENKNLRCEREPFTWMLYVAILSGLAAWGLLG